MKDFELLKEGTLEFKEGLGEIRLILRNEIYTVQYQPIRPDAFWVTIYQSFNQSKAEATYNEYACCA